MILYVLNDYRNAVERYKAGDVIEVSPEQAERLQKDSPGSFSTEPPKKAIDKPPVDKAVKSSTTKRK